MAMHGRVIWVISFCMVDDKSSPCSQLKMSTLLEPVSLLVFSITESFNLLIGKNGNSIPGTSAVLRRKGDAEGQAPEQIPQLRHKFGLTWA